MAGAAQGAISGGGLPGAAVGAGKGLVKGVLLNEKTRNWVVATVAVIAFAPLLIVGLAVASISQMTSVSAGATKEGETKQSEASVEASGYDPAALKAFLAGIDPNTSPVPWTLTLAVRTIADRDLDSRAFAEALRKVDPNGTSSEMGAGATYTSGSFQRTIDQSSASVSSKVKATYVQALERVPGLDANTAGRVYDQALMWELGQVNSCHTAPEGSGGAGSGHLTAEQTRTVQVAVGIAKAIFPNPDLAKRASIAAVTAGIVESGLRNPSGGDRDSVGTWQMRPSMGWGTVEQILNQDFAAAQWYQQMLVKDADTWQTRDIGLIAQDVEVSAFPEKYAVHVASATGYVSELFVSSPALPVPSPLAKGQIPWGVGGSGAAPSTGIATTSPATSVTCAPGGAGNVDADAKALALGLEQQMLAGNLTFLQTGTSTSDEILDIAHGRSGCNVGTGILQIITIALNVFGKAQVSDINRLCTGDQTNASVSPHTVNGGGRAVDFSGLGGQSITGADPSSIKLIMTLLPLLPDGGVVGLGQSDCRARAGTTITAPSVRQFTDACNHQHIDLGTTGNVLLNTTTPVSAPAS